MTTDALLGLLGPGWRMVLALAFAGITVAGLIRLSQRGRSRMARGVIVTGMLILSITVVGTLAVSCMPPTNSAGQRTGK